MTRTAQAPSWFDQWLVSWRESANTRSPLPQQLPSNVAVEAQGKSRNQRVKAAKDRRSQAFPPHLSHLSGLLQLTGTSQGKGVGDDHDGRLEP